MKVKISTKTIQQQLKELKGEYLLEGPGFSVDFTQENWDKLEDEIGRIIKERQEEGLDLLSFIEKTKF